jgi:hypothetical protein
MEDNFALKMGADFLRVLKLSDSITSAAIGIFERCELEIPRNKRTKVQIVAIAIASRMINHTIAIQSLTKLGYANQAEIIARSVFEELVNLSYVCVNNILPAEDLAERYIRYCTMTSALYGKKLSRAAVKISEEVKRKAEELKIEFKNRYPGKRDDDWSGKRIEEKAESGKMELLYHSLYLRMCHQSHGSPIAFEKQKNHENEFDIFDYQIGPSERDIYAGLLTSPRLLVIGCVRLATVFGLPSVVSQFSAQEDEFSQLVDTYYAEGNRNE